MNAFCFQRPWLVALVSGAAITSFSAQPTPPGAPPAPPGAINPPTVQPVIVTAPAATNPPAAVPAPPVVPGQPVPPAPPRVAPVPANVGPTTPPSALVWDAEQKEYTSKPGEPSAHFTFWLTNTHSSEVLINGVRTSCGCTVAKLPAQPWHIAPGEGGPIEVTVDLRGKSGTLNKTVTVESSSGYKALLVKVNITSDAGAVGGADSDRLKNMQLAMADRQILFKNADCAKCHADPGQDKKGQELYAAVCGICHDAVHRASAVPDLKLRHPNSAYDWKTWIMYGRQGSMMPAFAKSEGGPLTDEQISSLVDYLVAAHPPTPQPGFGAPATPVVATPPFTVPQLPVPPATPAPVQPTPRAVLPPVTPPPAIIRPPATLPAAKPAAAPATVAPTRTASRPANAADNISPFPFPKEK
jgi:mono/diheme cytochrome c family protein